MEGEDNMQAADAVEEPVKQTITFGHCPLCVGPLHNPITALCGCNFCYACFTDWVAMRKLSQANQQSKMLCPDCFKSIRGMFNGPFETMTASIQVNSLLAAALSVLDFTLEEGRTSDRLVDILLEKFNMNGTNMGVGAFADIVDNVSNLSLTEPEITRCKKDIERRQKILDAAITFRTLVHEELHRYALSEATVLSPFDKGMLVNSRMRREAETAFGKMPKRVYNAILVRTTPDMFSDPVKFKQLMQLPILGIAAAASVVIVECSCHNVNKVNDDLFSSPFWMTDPSSIAAVWIEDNSKVKTVKPAHVGKMHFFVAGTNSPTVCVLLERHKKDDVLEVRSPSLAHDLPATLYTNLATYLGPTYTERCVIGPTLTTQPGWDSIIPDIMKK